MTSKSSNSQQQAPSYPRHPFQCSIAEVTQHLTTDLDTGLTKSAAAEAQKVYGPNKLSGDGGVKWWTVLGKQLANAMILVGECVRERRA